MKTIATVCLLIGCGAQASEPARPPAQPEPAAPPAVVSSPAEPPPAEPAATPVVAPAPPPIATFEALTVAGELDAQKVQGLLDPMKSQLAECLGSVVPTTTELSLLIAKSDVGLRVAWQDDAVLVAPCLQTVFSSTQPDGARSVTTVYVVVKAGPSNAAWAAAPTLRERKAEFQRLFCDLEQLAGAEKIDVPEKGKVMQTWARANIKHPAPIQVAADVARWSPQERSSKLEKAIRAEGIKKCKLQRW